MKQLPFHIDLSGKTAVVTGGGGVLCSGFAKTIAACGAKVAVLDLNPAAAQKVVDEIIADGGKALAVATNVLQKASLEEARDKILSEFGSIDILINGAGGNNPRGTTSKEYLFPEDLDEGAKKDITTFFELDPDGVQFVFNLNFIGTLLPTQVFAKEMVKAEHPVILNVSSMNAFRPLTKIPAYSAAKAAVSNFTMWLAVHFPRSASASTPSHPDFSQRRRTMPFSLMRTVRSRREAIRSFRIRRWVASEFPRISTEHFCGFCPTKRRALSTALSSP